MSQLLRRNVIAALAPAGVPNCDIIVTDPTCERLWAIQVKTRRNLGSDGGWHMQQKHESLRSDRLLYCFVDFGTAASHAATTHVVPAAVVGKVLEESHQAWLAQPGKKGQQRNDSAFRRFLPAYSHLGLSTYPEGWLEKYRNAWDQLDPVI